MKLIDKHIKGFRKNSYIAQLLDLGLSIDEVHADIVKKFTPFFEKKDLIKDLLIGPLSTSIDTFMNIIIDKEKKKFLEVLLSIFRDAKKTDPNICFKSMVSWDERIKKIISQAVVTLNIERNRSKMDLEEFTRDIFDTIGNLTEGSLQVYSKLLYQQLSIAQGNYKTRNEINNLSYGTIVTELIKDSNIQKFLIVRDIKISQWRNIAQHIDYEVKVKDNKILCYYGQKIRKEKYIYKEELWDLCTSLIMLLGIFKTAHQIFYLDNIFGNSNLASNFSKEFRKETKFLHIFSGLAMYGFEVVSFRIDSKELYISLRDMTYHITNVIADGQNFPDYIHPDVYVGYEIHYDTSQRLYIVFKNEEGNIESKVSVSGSIHFSEIIFNTDPINTRKVSITDNVIYKYDVLEAPENLFGGTLYLTLGAGFNDVYYSQTDQVVAGAFEADILFYLLNSAGTKFPIGKIDRTLDSTLLGFMDRILEIDIMSINFEGFGEQYLAEALSKELGNDLLIEITTSIENYKFDFDYGKTDAYGIISLGQVDTSTQVNTGWIEFDLSPDLLPPSEESYSKIVIDGVELPYTLGYGFQKVGESRSDSVRLMYSDEDYSGGITPVDLHDPSLYIDLEEDGKSTTLELYNIPLLYAPELNLTFRIDSFGIDSLAGATQETNSLKIDYFFVANDMFNSYYKDSISLPLIYSDLNPAKDIDGGYTIRYKKDLQNMYDSFGTESFDCYISISQVGDGDNYIPFIILEQYDYICDEHLVEMHDRMPKNDLGNLDVRATINTPHYFQIFSEPLREDHNSPFDLPERAWATVEIEGMPYSSLVSFDATQGTFDYLGTKESFMPDQFNLITNLGMFTSGYDIDEVIVQDGFLNLYSGTGTEVHGARDFDRRFEMNPLLELTENYFSEIFNDGTNNYAISWGNDYLLTEQFLTTEEITVSGTVFYHQLFSLEFDAGTGQYIDPNYVEYSRLDEIFGDQLPDGIHFGFQLPEDVSIAYIRQVGKPYAYDISVQGYPIGYDSDYCQVPVPSSSSQYAPSEGEEQVLSYSDYSLEYIPNGTKYLVFYKDSAEIITNNDYVDEQYRIMMDFSSYRTFAEGADYRIIEKAIKIDDSELITTTSLEWSYLINSLDVGGYTYHPDFSSSASFSVQYSAFQWDYQTQSYLEETTDQFVFQPRIATNISILYDDEVSTDSFSIFNIVPENQWSGDNLFDFNSIHFLTWDAQNEDYSTIQERTINNVKLYSDYEDDWYVKKDDSVEYSYIINFDNIMSDHPSWGEIFSSSYVYVEVEFDSTQDRYPLISTPFNYDYLDAGVSYHILVSLTHDTYTYPNDGEFNSTIPEFNDFIRKIEDDYIYFYNREAEDTEPGYIEPGTEVSVTYIRKERPGLLDKKHFLMVIYPWTNVFDTVVDDFMFDISDSSDIAYRNKYRQLSGSSIITPFEYSFSIEDKYSIYLSYRLTQRDYFEEKFTIQYNDAGDYVFDILGNIGNYFSVEDSFFNVFYYDREGRLHILDESLFNVDTVQKKLTLYRDYNNPIVRVNSLRDFYLSFVSNADKEYDSYKFSYDPNDELINSIKVENWYLSNVENLDVFPNFDAYYFVDDYQSSYKKMVCYASQIVTTIEELGTENSLVFDLGAELDPDLDPEFINQELKDLLTDIRQGLYTSIYFDANIKNYEIIKGITVKLLNSGGSIIGAPKSIPIEDLIMYDFTIKVDLPSGLNDLQKIEFIPEFMTDEELTINNKISEKIGVLHYDIIQWDEEAAKWDIDGNKYMKVFLEYDLKTELEGDRKVAYLFNDKFQHLELPEGNDIVSKSEKDEELGIKTDVLYIYSSYYDPDSADPENPTELIFKDGDMIIVKYSSPVEKAISVAIGKSYYQRVPYTNPPEILPPAEILFINGFDYSDYSEYKKPYYLQAPLQLTPFDTDHTNSYKSIKIDIAGEELSDILLTFDPNLSPADLSALKAQDSFEFTDIIISVPYPYYELVIDQILIQRILNEPTLESGSFFERVWQFTEQNSYISGETPDDPDPGERDAYEFDPSGINIFGGIDWLDYLKIYDANYNYYRASDSTGAANQLIWESNAFRWNGNFEPFQEYFGNSIELPTSIEPETELFIQYCTDDSWKEPIILNYESVDFDSIDIIYNYEFWLAPDNELWYDEIINNADPDYNITQYYLETFTVYSYETSDPNGYTFHFEI